MSTYVLQKLLPSKLELREDFSNKWSIYPCGKKTRSSFPISNIKRTDIFDLVHTDMRRPYKTLTIIGSKYFLIIVNDCTRMT